MSSEVISPEYERVADDAFDPYALPHTTTTAHTYQHSQKSSTGHTGPKSSESVELQESRWFERPTEPTKQAKTTASAASLIKLAILPIITVAYLAFCYTVQKRVVIIDGKGEVDTSPERLATIKSAITAVSILLITLGLWPLVSLLDELKQEEFFRVLHRRPEGVPFSVINDISSATFLRSMAAIIKRKVSPYFVVAFIAGLVSFVISTVAPAALSVESVILDDDLVAFEVGAIPAGSIINTTDALFDIDMLTEWSRSFEAVKGRSDQAATLAWAEIDLGVHYQFTADDQDDQTHLVPYPSKLLTNTRARWLTDVVVVSPECQWLQTNITDRMDMHANLSDIGLQKIAINIPAWGIDFAFSTLGLGFNPISIGLIETFEVKNASTKHPADGGQMIWTLTQCQKCIGPSGPGLDRISLDLSNIPTFLLSGLDSEHQLGVLGCRPNLRVETREVRSTGGGRLVVFPDRYKPQGNIHPLQAAFLLRGALMSIPNNAGPILGAFAPGFGSRVVSTFFFGDQVSAYNDSLANADKYVWAPAPLANTTQIYRQLLRSATKPYLSGALGTAYVPGRTSREAVIFTSSGTYTAVSAAFLVIISGLVVFSHFRKGKGETFTLFSVAAALDGSEVIPQSAQFKHEHSDITGQLLKATVEEMWGGRSIVLARELHGKARLGFGSERLD